MYRSHCSFCFFTFACGEFYFVNNTSLSTSVYCGSYRLSMVYTHTSLLGQIVFLTIEVGLWPPLVASAGHSHVHYSDIISCKRPYCLLELVLSQLVRPLKFLAVVRGSCISSHRNDFVLFKVPSTPEWLINFEGSFGSCSPTTLSPLCVLSAVKNWNVICFRNSRHAFYFNTRNVHTFVLVSFFIKQGESESFDMPTELPDVYVLCASLRYQNSLCYLWS